MSQDNLVKIKCQETGQIMHTRKNRKGVERKLELKKFNSTLKKRTIWKETKK
jgi:ribosomal protein L33